MFNKKKICIIGLGYVGLQLAYNFSKYFETIGFDLNKIKIKELIKGTDKENILSKKFLNPKLKFTYNEKVIKNCDIYIVAVPTPISSLKKPDLTQLIQATKLVASNLKSGDLVIYESTVYPGTTEDICIPLLKKISKLNLLTDRDEYKKNYFECGYSPERINPGDKKRTVEKIIKVVSGSSKKTLNKVNKLYTYIAKKGCYRADSIKIAEAAKIIENVQRDINIALINEFSLLFKKINLNIHDVLEVARTKWNFLNFNPGLVGGHCIGVDPYYLTYLAKKIGYTPKLLLAGRSINDGLTRQVHREILKLTKKKIKKNKVKILVLGFTFKENVSDIRNTKVLTLIKLFDTKKFLIKVYDPLVIKTKSTNQSKINFLKKINFKEKYDIIINAINHDILNKLDFKRIKKLLNTNSIVYDLRNKFPRNEIDGSI